MKKYIILLVFLFCKESMEQSTFDYNVQITPITISTLPGLHSYAFAQHNGKWLIIGGRTDGLHRRQPFASFDINGDPLPITPLANIAQGDPSTNFLDSVVVGAPYHFYFGLNNGKTAINRFYKLYVATAEE